jgi:hypothetical protein
MLLSFKESWEILNRYEIPLVESYVVKNKEDLSLMLEKLNFPVVMKIDSKEIVHKTDQGGVRLNITNEDEAFKNLDELLIICNEGVVVQEQTIGEEIIVGGKKDESFGPIIMIGLGGILVEIYKDIVFRLAPLNHTEASDMIEDIKGKKILEGFRGRPKVNKDSLAELIVKTSHLLEKESGIKELDFNPVLSADRSLVCDVKLIV